MCDSLSNFIFIIVGASVATCIALPTAHIHRNCKICSPHRSCVYCACDCLVVFFYPHQFCYDVLNERWSPPCLVVGLCIVEAPAKLYTRPTDAQTKEHLLWLGGVHFGVDMSHIFIMTASPIFFHHHRPCVDRNIYRFLEMFMELHIFSPIVVDVRRFSIDARSIFDRCSIDVRSMFDRCSIDFL